MRSEIYWFPNLPRISLLPWEARKMGAIVHLTSPPKHLFYNIELCWKGRFYSSVASFPESSLIVEVVGKEMNAT